MSQQDNFVGGFIAGALFGGLVGGVIGALAANRLKAIEDEPESPALKRDNGSRDRFGEATEESMEIARRRLEDKIAQLNEAIDDVRQQMGGMSLYPYEAAEDSSLIDS